MVGLGSGGVINSWKMYYLFVLFFLCKDKMMKNYNDSNKNNDIMILLLKIHPMSCRKLLNNIISDLFQEDLCSPAVWEALSRYPWSPSADRSLHGCRGISLKFRGIDEPQRFFVDLTSILPWCLFRSRVACMVVPPTLGGAVKSWNNCFLCRCANRKLAYVSVAEEKSVFSLSTGPTLI